MRHACANPHCVERALIAMDQIACPACWAILPKQLQEAMAQAVRTRSRAYGAHTLTARTLWANAARIGEAFNRSKI